MDGFFEGFEKEASAKAIASSAKPSKMKLLFKQLMKDAKGQVFKRKR